MSRQDRQGVRRPAELEQKYNLGYSLDDLKNATKRLDSQITSQGQAMALFEEATQKTQESLALEVSNLNINVSIVQKGQQELNSDVQLLNDEMSVIKKTQTEVADDVSTLEQNVSNLQQSQVELSQDITELGNELSTVKKGQQELTSDVSLLNDEISVIKNTQTEIVNDVSTLEQNVSNLQQSQNALSQDITNLDNALSQDISNLDNELSTHTHSYAGSSSHGGSATSAEKLTTDAGDENTPVYFSGGKPAPCTSLDLNTTGNAATATALETARKFRTNLGSTSQASFKGTGNCNPGVTGTLGIGNGGTGATTASDALAALGGTTATGHSHDGMSLSPASLELHPGSSAGHGGFIDFHFNNNSGDYTSRIIESASGVLLLNGSGLLTKANVIALYNVTVSFSSGLATYSNSAIKSNSVVFVQRRAGSAGAAIPLAITVASGKVTVASNSSVGGNVALNILIMNVS